MSSAHQSFRVCVAACVVASLQPQLHAVCVGLSFKELRAERGIVLIFHGTVQNVQPTPSGEIVTFEVARVWKGKVPRRITIYNPGSARELAEWLSFARGTGYFVTAYRLGREERVAFGFPDSGPAVYGAGYCSAHIADATRARADADNDPGHEPSQKQ